MNLTIPPYLKKGDTIAITCPAGYMDAAKAITCISTLQSWGLHVVVGNTLGSSSKTYFSGTDAQRRDELQAMLNEPTIKAILCGRGGYGIGRIIDALDFSLYAQNPKWIIGFSDVTVLHSHIHTVLQCATLHAPMAAAFNKGNSTANAIASIKDALLGKKTTYTHTPHKYNITGKATGLLVGGNLSLIAHLIGTSSDIHTHGKILCLEDVGEQLYNIDRMLYQLKRAQKLENLAGLILGGFTDCKDTERPFGKKIDALIKDVLGDVTYPVAYHFPISHGRHNVAVKLGVTHTLTVTARQVQLKQL